MSLILRPDTERLLRERAEQMGFESPDDLVLSMLETFGPDQVVQLGDLDDETRAAIEQADKQEDIAWESVRDGLVRRFGNAE